jgi:CRISPR/Cas system CSM-associated protein Csm2 small subunit
MDRTRRILCPAEAERETLELEITPCLDNLRQVLADVAQAYTARLDSRLVSVLDIVTDRYSRDDRQTRIKPSMIRSMRNAFDKLRIKPHKGRRRDLKRIEKFIEEMEDLLGPWS